MLYNVKKLDNYCNFKVFKDNRIDGRAYFIPFPSEAKAAAATTVNKRYTSEKVMCLNGEWDFRYYRNYKEVPETLDTEKTEFDKIPVPSCWQFLGYEPPFYTNVQYPYLPVPLKTPTHTVEGVYKNAIDGETYAVGEKQYNSVGIYRKKFTLNDLKKRFILSFYGVSSSAEIYINGRYVGYSECSHNTAEYFIDNYVNVGENELVVVVHKWCNGSYLEDQDMFRNNGIFRDVVIFVNEPTFVFDFEFFTTKRKELYDAILNISVANFDGASIVATLSDGKKVIAMRSVEAAPDTKIMFDSLNVQEWNAEIPKLYELTITLMSEGKITECIKKKVGFKTINIEGKVFYFNGKKIKTRGVNHHDTNPRTGYYLTPEEIEYDIRLCKEFNINTVRTSHYPPDPTFIELADLYGLYIVDEADIETHGTNRPGEISDKLKWKEHYWDRVHSMYLRDRNSPCILMWSLGNESGGIRCHDYCYKKLKELTLIPIHYERAIDTRRGAFDVTSTMYTNQPSCEKIGRGKMKARHSATKAYKTKPFFMCEYAHAMGVGPGNLEEYWDTFYKYDNIMGGCIWEMFDHAVLHGEDKPYRYTYGGDHGEYTHDGNFCVDGLFFPDRTPHTGAYAIKNVYRPLRGKVVGAGVIEIRNYNNFRNADYLKIKGTLLHEGNAAFTFELPSDIPAGESKCFNLNFDIKEGDSAINLDYYDGERLVATEQLRVNEAITQVKLSKGKSVVAKDGGNITEVIFDNGSIRFDKHSGILIGYSIGETSYLADKPARENGSKGRLYPNIYRAPTDNDRNVMHSWHRFEYDKLVTVCTSFVTKQFSERVEVHVTSDMRNSKDRTLFEVRDRYTVFANGIVGVESILVPLNKLAPILPRVGKTIELKPEFDDVIYYGNGDKENYPDFKTQSRLGVYRKKVGDFLEPYIKPQESGNRTDVRYAAVKNEKGEGLMFLADTRPFNFGAKKISDVELAKCKHREDIKEENVSYISIDGYMGGIGSNSCGPLSLPKYLLKTNRSYTFSFRMIPFTALDEDIFNTETTETK